MYNIYPCSDKAKKLILTDVDTVGTAEYSEKTWDDIKSVYPWKFLHIGESFAVPFSNCSEMWVRVNASKTGKKLGKKFGVLKHIEYCVYEVVRRA